jgi:nitrite reductase/ring-hydroxylating ferredoxin subunit
MAASAPFLDNPYGGYLHSQVAAEDKELTHVGPGTPCGEWFRRFWLPVAISGELKDLPKAVRILAEDLVVFRDRSDHVGLLELHCSHRGTSLEFGQIEEHGIRCCYHAWCFDVDGRILDTPGEPEDSTLKDRLYHGAYPTHEYKGLVFAYLGPPDMRPAFPKYDVYDLPGFQMLAGLQYVRDCNWLQCKENAMDPAHVTFLHTLPGNSFFSPDFKGSSEWDFIKTPIGMLSVDTRRFGDKVWVHASDYILPSINQGVGITETIEQRTEFNRTPWMTWWVVPIDDTNCMQLGYWYGPENQKLSIEHGFGQTGDRPYRERQRVPGDYDSQVGQRPIAVHAMEHLATTDRGVTMLRQMIRQGIRDVQNGKSPKGVEHDDRVGIPTYSYERVLTLAPADTDEEDKQLLHETGRRLTEERIKHLAGQ